MAKKSGDKCPKEISNRDLFKLIQNLEAKFEERFAELKPYVETWDDVRSAGRVGSYVVGFMMSVGALYLMIVNVWKA